MSGAREDRGQGHLANEAQGAQGHPPQGGTSNCRDPMADNHRRRHFDFGTSGHHQTQMGEAFPITWETRIAPKYRLSKAELSWLTSKISSEVSTRQSSHP